MMELPHSSATISSGFSGGAAWGRKYSRAPPPRDGKYHESDRKPKYPVKIKLSTEMPLCKQANIEDLEKKGHFPDPSQVYVVYYYCKHLRSATLLRLVNPFEFLVRTHGGERIFKVHYKFITLVYDKPNNKRYFGYDVCKFVEKYPKYSVSFETDPEVHRIAGVSPDISLPASGPESDKLDSSAKDEIVELQRKYIGVLEERLKDRLTIEDLSNRIIRLEQKNIHLDNHNAMLIEERKTLNVDSQNNVYVTKISELEKQISELREELVHVQFELEKTNTYVDHVDSVVNTNLEELYMYDLTVVKKSDGISYARIRPIFQRFGVSQKSIDVTLRCFNHEDDSLLGPIEMNVLKNNTHAHQDIMHHIYQEILLMRRPQSF